jgi:hypothetical protein
LPPSAEEATADHQISVVALFNIQFWAGAKLAVNEAPETNRRILKFFIMVESYGLIQG